MITVRTVLNADVSKNINKRIICVLSGKRQNPSMFKGLDYYFSNSLKIITKLYIFRDSKMQNYNIYLYVLLFITSQTDTLISI